MFAIMSNDCLEPYFFETRIKAHQYIERVLVKGYRRDHPDAFFEYRSDTWNLKGGMLYIRIKPLTKWSG